MKNLLLLIVLTISFQGYGQTKMWSQKVSKGAFISQLDDGKIFLKNKTKISLINNVTGDIEWSNNVATKDDPKFLDGLPIMYFEGKSYAVIDASTGDVIDESKVKTTVLNTSYYWDKGKVVMELSRKKKLNVLSIDLNDLSKSWTTEVGKVQKSFMGLVTRSTANQPSFAANGTMILVDKKFISYISAEGKIMDRVEYKKDIEKLGYNNEMDILYVLEDNKKLHFIDVVSNKTINTVELKEKNPDFSILDNGNSVAVTQKKELLMLNAKDGNEIKRHSFDDKVNFTYNDGANNKFYVLVKKDIVELNVADGSIVSQKTLDDDYNEIYTVGDKTVIAKSGKVNLIDLSAMKNQYAKAARIPAVQDHLVMGNLDIFTHQSVGKFFLTAMDQKGKKVWDNQYVAANTPALDVIDGNLLIITTEEAEYISAKTGKKIWKEKISTGPSFDFTVDKANDRLVMHSDKKLAFIDLKTGKLTKTKEKLKFKDFDYETQSPTIIAGSDYILLKGSNTIYVTDKKGSVKMKEDYKSVDNNSGLMKMASIAVTVGAIATGNAGKVITVHQNGEMVHKGSMVDGLNDTWADAESAKAERQAKQNKTSNAFPYVYTKLKSKKKALVFIDPATGKERFDVVVNEKTPNYIVDEVDGVLFVVSQTSLKAFDLK